MLRIVIEEYPEGLGENDGKNVKTLGFINIYPTDKKLLPHKNSYFYYHTYRTVYVDEDLSILSRNGSVVHNTKDSFWLLLQTIIGQITDRDKGRFEIGS
jgi:hypothetical protein